MHKYKSHVMILYGFIFVGNAGSPRCAEDYKKDPLRYLHFWIRRDPLGVGIVLDKSNLLLLGSNGQKKKKNITQPFFVL